MYFSLSSVSIVNMKFSTVDKSANYQIFIIRGIRKNILYIWIRKVITFCTVVSSLPFFDNCYRSLLIAAIVVWLSVFSILHFFSLIWFLFKIISPFIWNVCYLYFQMYKLICCFYYVFSHLFPKIFEDVPECSVIHLVALIIFQTPPNSPSFLIYIVSMLICFSFLICLFPGAFSLLFQFDYTYFIWYDFPPFLNISNSISVSTILWYSHICDLFLFLCIFVHFF